MPKRISFFSEIFVRFCLFASLISLSACGTVPITNNTNPLLPSCDAMSSDENPYTSHEIVKNVDDIFIHYRQSQTQNEKDNMKQDALMQLGKNMKRWSDYKNIINDNNQMIRVGITYLDPALLQYIILNNLLSMSDDKLNVINIENEIRQRVGEIAGRGNLLFVLTITSPFNNVFSSNSSKLNVELPVEELILVNSSGMKTIPSDYDHILTESIDITLGPIYGIVGYPVYVMYQDKCTPFIDKWTSSFTLDIIALNFGGQTFNNLFWNIPFQPLITQDNEHLTPVFDPSYTDRTKRNEKPPTPDLRTNASLNEADSLLYWEEVGRYFWHVLIRDSGH